MDDFVPYPKTPRMTACEMVVTEKIDGTNAQVVIEQITPDTVADFGIISPRTGLRMRCGSRNRWISPNDDNAGFARWAYDNVDELTTLGPGRHFGEWWGEGIQRRYDMTEKRFSLFNAVRWTEKPRPACCDVVPILYRGKFDTAAIDLALLELAVNGSKAAPGFMKTEGVCVYLSGADKVFKVITDK